MTALVDLATGGPPPTPGRAAARSHVPAAGPGSVVAVGGLERVSALPDSPALAVAALLHQAGAVMVAHDPALSENDFTGASPQTPEWAQPHTPLWYRAARDPSPRAEFAQRDVHC